MNTRNQGAVEWTHLGTTHGSGQGPSISESKSACCLPNCAHQDGQSVEMVQVLGSASKQPPGSPGLEDKGILDGASMLSTGCLCAPITWSHVCEETGQGLCDPRAGVGIGRQFAFQRRVLECWSDSTAETALILHGANPG